MEIQTEKLTFEEKLFKRNANQKTDWWDELSEEQKNEIEEGERQIERGEYVNFETFIQKYL
jgi:predicted transcriptional regulator